VGGAVDRVHQELAIAPVEAREKYQKYGVPVPNGIVFTGPPGTGKSTLARALASSLGREFLDISLSDIRGSLAGESEQNVAALFEQARAHSPCVVVIDEVDAMISDRTSAGDKAEMRQLISQFLRDMPSLSDEEVLIVGTTNLKGDLDDAATRPGRFGEQFEIGIPDLACREAVLRVHLEDRPAALGDVDLRAIARATVDYSCADLEKVVQEAGRRALKKDAYITQTDLHAAVEKTESSVDTSKW